MTNDPAIAVVILNWNGRQDTLACLDSLASCEGDITPIVVDNASSDGTPEAIRSAYPDIRLIENSTNLGFAEGNNVGIRCALMMGVDAVLILNNDTTVAPNAIALMAAQLTKLPDVGAICPLIYFADEPDRIWYGGGGFNPDKGRSGRVALYRQRASLSSAPRRVDRTTGAAMLVPCRVLKEIGGFDAGLFLYYEDVDWSLRATRAGYRIWLAPDAHVWHGVSRAAGGESSPLVGYYDTRNHLEVCTRYARHGRLRAAWRAAVIVAVHCALVRRAERPLPYLTSVIAGWRDYLAGRFGPRSR